MANVTDTEFKEYLQVFHNTLQSTADRFLDEQHKSQLTHLANLPSRIVGYVSTQFGVGFEYLDSESTTIEVVRGSSRVEDLFFQAPRRLREGASFMAIQGKNVTLKGGTYDGAFPFRLTSDEASVTVVLQVDGQGSSSMVSSTHHARKHSGALRALLGERRTKF
jgi:hypothetical protein